MTGKKLDTILIVDDDEVANFIYGKIISNADISHNIKSFQAAQEALEYLKDCVSGKFTTPEVIFLDINMPIMSGWDFLTEYKKFASELKGKTNVFMLSSSVYQEDIEKAKSYEEVDEYIIKPLTSEKLLDIRQRYFSN